MFKHEVFRVVLHFWNYQNYLSALFTANKSPVDFNNFESHY